MGIEILNPEQTVKLTVLKPIMFNPVGSSTMTIGRVVLSRIELTEGQTVSGINIWNGSTVDGNITVGIYAEIAGTPAGGALIVESASIAQSGINDFQTFPIATTYLPAGAYYIACELSSATGVIAASPTFRLFVNQGYRYARSGGYGALTDPCPAVTSDTAVIPAMVLLSP